MAGSILHVYTQTVPDGPFTSVVRPSDWNSNHTYSGIPDGISIVGGNTAGALAAISSGTLYLAGGANITLSQQNNSITISATQQSVQTQNCVDVTIGGNSTSAGGGFGLISSGTMLLAGGNNITISQNGNSITLSGANAGGAQTGISGVVASNATYTSGTITITGVGGGVTVNSNTGQRIDISVAAPVAQSNQSAIKGLGASNTGNTAGNTGISTGVDWVLAASNSLTISESTAGGGPNTLWVQVGAYITTADASQNSSNYIRNWKLTGNTAGTTSSAQGTDLWIAGGNNITVSGNSNSITISGVNTVAQTNQSAIKGLGVSNTGNTAGNTGLSTGIDWVLAGTNGITASESTTPGGPNTIWISGVTTVAQSNQSAIKGLGASNTGNTAGNTGISTGVDWVLAASNSLTISESTAAGGPNTLWLQVGAYITTADLSQNSSKYAQNWKLTGNTAGTTSSAFGTDLWIAGGNNITVSGSSNSITISGANIGGAQTGISGVADGAGTQTKGTISFANSNGVTFGLSTGANTGTITASVAAQSNQTLSFAATSNTAGNTSGLTVDARSLTLAGYGAASVGFSTSAGGSTALVSVPVQSAQSAIKGLGASNTGNTAGNTGLSTGIDWVVAGTNNITISESTAGGGPNTLWISGPTVGGAQTGISSVAAAGGTQTAGMISFINSNNVTFGMSTGAVTGSITASYALNVSAGGGTSNALSAITFTNSNGVTFGLSTGAGVGTLTASVAAQSVQPAVNAIGVSNIGNTAGNTGTSSGITFVIAGSNGITASQSTAGGGPDTIWISGVTTVAQSNQTLSAIVSSNTVGNTSAMTFDARSVSFQGYGAASVGLSTTNTGSSILVSVPVQSAQTQSLIQAVYDGANSITTGTVRLTNANGVSFSINGQTLSASVAAQTNQTLSAIVSSNTVGNTSAMTFDARSVSFQGYGAASVGLSTTNTGSSILVSVPVQSVQTQNCVDVSLSGNSTSAGAGYILISSGTMILAGGNNVTLSQNGQSVTISAGQAAAGIASIAGAGGTQTTGMVSFINSNNVSFGMSTGAVTGSMTASYALNVSAGGGTSNALSAITFTNSNGVTFGLSTGAGVGTLTASVAAQSNQTLSLAATSNTAGNTSGLTVDARSLTFAGYGAASVGFSTSAGGSTALVSVAAQTNQTLGFYATGNTTSSASSTTYDARSVSYSGAGAISVGMSGASGIVVSSPVTSSLVGYNGITVVTNASTISVGNIPLSAWEPFPILTGTAYSSHAPASWWFNRVVLPDVLAISNINVAKSLSVAVFVPVAASSGTQKYSYSHGITVFSRQNYGAQSSNFTTVTTASFGMTASLSVNTSSVSAALSFVTNSTGGTTSQSTTFNGASFGSWSVYFSGPFIMQVPCVTTLQPGEYFFAHAHSSTAATGGNAIFALSTNLLSVSNMHIAPQVAGPFQTLGQSITQASLNPWGMGGGIASAVTTNASMAGSVVSGQTQNNWYMALSNV